MQIAEAVRNAGVVGAGGAGFPTHVKLEGEAEYVLANGAECEPLLHKDAELTQAYVDQVLRGMELSREATGASEMIFGIKSKKKQAVAALESRVQLAEKRVDDAVREASGHRAEVATVLVDRDRDRLLIFFVGVVLFYTAALFYLLAELVVPAFFPVLHLAFRPTVACAAAAAFLA